jgi:hypothetical protein
MVLLSCSDPRAPGRPSTTSSIGFESVAPVQRAPLAPLQRYAAPPPLAGPGGEATGQTSAPGWQASPRWAAIKGNGCIEVEPDPRAKPGSGMKVETCAGEKAQVPPREKSVEIASPDAAEPAPQGEPVEMAPQDADPNMPAPE